MRCAADFTGGGNPWNAAGNARDAVIATETALAAATVAAAEIAVNTATHAMVSHPLLRHLAGDVAGAGVAARRMIVLARAAAAACSPILRLG